MSGSAALIGRPTQGLESLLLEVLGADKFGARPGGYGERMLLSLADMGLVTATGLQAAISTDSPVSLGLHHTTGRGRVRDRKLAPRPRQAVWLDVPKLKGKISLVNELLKTRTGDAETLAEETLGKLVDLLEAERGAGRASDQASNFLIPPGSRRSSVFSGDRP